MRITSVAVTPGGVHAQVEADGSSLQHAVEVYLAAALDHSDSQVLHGENGGRHLSHVAVVRAIQKVGSLKKGEVYKQDVELKLKPGIDQSNLRVIAFVQEKGAGKVLGAVMQKPGS